MIILLDEYDTPMQEAYVRVSKESIFSDLNNLKVVTTTSDEYAESFGFTQKEVFEALEECGLSDKKEKEKFEALIQGEVIQSPIDEQIVYNQLDHDDSAIWSLLLASGYLKVLSYEREDMMEYGQAPQYELTLTNYEVKRMFYSMVRGWFQDAQLDYNDFVKAMLQDDLDAMNEYMNRVALKTFSYFDTGSRPSGAEPERFYHGFVLCMIVDLQSRYVITSNGESGFGRYHIMLEPRNPQEDDAIILEFKVFNRRRENSLEDTVHWALDQIEKMRYAEKLEERGIPKKQIRRYGFAFRGKEVLIG